LQKAAS